MTERMIAELMPSLGNLLQELRILLRAPTEDKEGDFHFFFVEKIQQRQSGIRNRSVIERQHQMRSLALCQLWFTPVTMR